MNRRLYPRTVSIYRPGGRTGVGFQPGTGTELAADETLRFSNLPASIQARREGSRNPTGLPTDATKPIWFVFIPASALALGSVQDRDVIVDDLGARHQVLADYWNVLGYRLSVERLEA